MIRISWELKSSSCISKEEIYARCRTDDESSTGDMGDDREVALSK